MNPYLETDFSYLVEGLKGNRLISVTNMSRKRVAYTIDEINVSREFRQFQEGVNADKKNIPFGELFALNNMPGGSQLIWDNLKIDSNEAREALGLPLAEDTPEVEYTKEKVAEILNKGTEEQILDMLEFGPYYIAEWVKEESISVDSASRRTFIGNVFKIDIDNLQRNLDWASEDAEASRLQYNTIKGSKTAENSNKGQRRSGSLVGTNKEKGNPGRRRRT